MTPDGNPLSDGTLAVEIGGLDVTAAVLPGLGYSNTNPGGFGEATIRLPATDPWSPYNVAVVKGAAVTIKHGAASVTLFEGEVTNDVSHAVIEGGTAYYDVTCAGLWWKAGQRGDFCRVIGDDDYGQWFERGDNQQGFTVTTDGKLEIRLEEGQSVKANARCSLYYWLDNGMGDPAAVIDSLLGVVAVDVNAEHWHASIEGSDSPWGTWTALDALATWAWDSQTSAPLRVDAACACIRITMWVSDDGVRKNVPADLFITLTKAMVARGIWDFSITGITKASPAVVTTSAAHGLKAGDRIFINGSDSVASIDGWRTVGTGLSPTTFNMTGVNVTGSAGADGGLVRAKRVDEALADIALTTGLATSSNVQTVGIGLGNWGLNVRPHVSRAEAIDLFAMTHSAPIDYGFWEGAAFNRKERATPAAANDYLIDSNLPGIDSAVFAATEESPTHVKVLYKFRDVDGGTSVYPDGTVLAVYRPYVPTWDDASVVLDVWDEWADLSLETGQARDLCDQILAWIAANAYQGEHVIATPTVPLRTTGTKLTAYIRGGDYIEDANLANTNLATGRLMITSFSMDADSGVATLGIGENRRDFVARITPRAAKKKRKRRG